MVRSDVLAIGYFPSGIRLDKLLAIFDALELALAAQGDICKSRNGCAATVAMMKTLSVMASGGAARLISMRGVDWVLIFRFAYIPLCCERQFKILIGLKILLEHLGILVL